MRDDEEAAVICAATNSSSVPGNAGACAAVGLSTRACLKAPCRGRDRCAEIDLVEEVWVAACVRRASSNHDGGGAVAIFSIFECLRLVSQCML